MNVIYSKVILLKHFFLIVKGNLMEREHALVTLFYTLADQEPSSILELLNIDNKPVGALYLDKVKYKNLIISETNNSEKYYLYLDGLGIYFSFYRKITA